MRIIAFGHRQDVGKSTAARFLAAELRLKGENVVQAGFADKVKDVAYQLYAWAGLQPGHHYELLENYHLKNIVLPKISRTPRDLWIGVGNGIRQATGYDGTWLDYLFKTLKFETLIITDLRFPAEADGILREGGQIYRIDRSATKKVTDGADDPLENYTRWTGIIENNATLNDFHRQIVNIIGK